MHIVQSLTSWDLRASKENLCSQAFDFRKTLVVFWHSNALAVWESRPVQRTAQHPHVVNFSLRPNGIYPLPLSTFISGETASVLRWNCRNEESGSKNTNIRLDHTTKSTEIGSLTRVSSWQLFGCPRFELHSLCWRDVNGSRSGNVSAAMKIDCKSTFTEGFYTHWGTSQDCLCMLANVAPAPYLQVSFGFFIFPRRKVSYVVLPTIRRGSMDVDDWCKLLRKQSFFVDSVQLNLRSLDCKRCQIDYG